MRYQLKASSSTHHAVFHIEATTAPEREILAALAKNRIFVHTEPASAVGILTLDIEMVIDTEEQALEDLRVAVANKYDGGAGVGMSFSEDTPGEWTMLLYRSTFQKRTERLHTTKGVTRLDAILRMVVALQ